MPPSVDDLPCFPVQAGATAREECTFVSSVSCNLERPIKHRIPSEFGIVLALCLAGCATTNSVRQSDTDLSSAFLASIHDEALTLVRKYQTSPLRAARMLAYLDSAVLETSRSIAGTGAKAGGCDHVAYMSASYAVLAHFFPLETPGRLLSRPRLSPDWSTANCDGTKRNAEVAAQASIARAMRDGANPPKKVRAHPGRAVGLWEPTPPLFSANPTEPYAG